MKLLFIKSILLLLPFALWTCLVVLVDPYNYFDVSHIIPDIVKKQTSLPSNRFLWKIILFKRTPSANILLGDSRVDAIDVNYIDKISGEKYFNFAHGGASLPDIINTFHYAKRTIKLSNVYIGLNFNLYNSYNESNRFAAAELISNDLKYYIFDKDVIKTTYYNLATFYSNKDFHIGSPSLDKDSFWKSQLVTAVPIFYKHYKYPNNYYNKLKDISDYCKINNINLTFIIPPTHIDLQKRVADFGLLEEEKNFKKDLRSLGKVYDFDYPNDWTNNRENFNDPFHLTKAMMEKFVDEIWGDEHNIAKISNKPAL